MSTEHVTLPRAAAALAAVALLLAGGGATYLLTRTGAARGDETADVQTHGTVSATPTGTPSASSASQSGRAPLADLPVPVGREAAERAGIAVAAVESGTSAAEIRLPGTVEPNAYRQVAVTPLVAGRVTQVSAELGDRVRRGQTIARIHSPELADAQTRYIAARAMLDAHDRELQRTQKLVEIGAASRQELERIHAEHAAQTAAVQSARSQLDLLGVPATVIDGATHGTEVTATASVPAPIDGVVTERLANIGLNVDPAMKLFTIVDLAMVWVVADAYEKDFARIRVGGGATVTTAAFPGRTFRGRVSYIDPQVSPATRTAKVRVEVPNPGGELRLGMYAEMVVGATGASTIVIPRGAVQNVGDRTVVYLVENKEPGMFIEREVHLGQSAGDTVEVASGVQPGDVVVTTGSFFVRAERERLGLRAQVAPAPAAATPAADRQTAQVLVTEQGYQPAQVMLRAGTPAAITFLRTTDKTCGTEVVFPSLNIKRALPLNEPVTIEFTPASTGPIAFACGMNMLKGTVLVQ
jgi:RND family efflux transporter MFP subunit